MAVARRALLQSAQAATRTASRGRRGRDQIRLAHATTRQRREPFVPHGTFAAVGARAWEWSRGPPSAICSGARVIGTPRRAARRDARNTARHFGGRPRGCHAGRGRGRGRRRRNLGPRSSDGGPECCGRRSRHLHGSRASPGGLENGPLFGRKAKGFSRAFQILPSPWRSDLLMVTW